MVLSLLSRNTFWQCTLKITTREQGENKHNTHTHTHTQQSSLKGKTLFCNSITSSKSAMKGIQTSHVCMLGKRVGQWPLLLVVTVVTDSPPCVYTHTHPIPERRLEGRQCLIASLCASKCTAMAEIFSNQGGWWWWGGGGRYQTRPR